MAASEGLLSVALCNSQGSVLNGRRPVPGRWTAAEQRAHFVRAGWFAAGV